MIYAVDFDGTLCSDAFPKIGEPNEKLAHLPADAGDIARRDGRGSIAAFVTPSEPWSTMR